MDSEAKWTPGDWEADDGDGQYYGIFDENGAPLAYLAEEGRPLPILDDHVERAERHVANAKLMAAAPKLYAALKALRDLVASNPAMQGRENIDVGVQVHAALKATGAQT